MTSVNGVVTPVSKRWSESDVFFPTRHTARYLRVARIEAQSRGNAGQPVGSMVSVMSDIVRVDGVGGLFRGITPRVFLGIWQTLFMVTGAKIFKDELRKNGLIT